MATQPKPQSHYLIEMGKPQKFKPEDLIKFREKGKYQDILDALLELNPGETQNFKITSPRVARSIAGCLSTRIRRINKQRKPGKEDVFKFRIENSIMKVFRFQ